MLKEFQNQCVRSLETPFALSILLKPQHVPFWHKATKLPENTLTAPILMLYAADHFHICRLAISWIAKAFIFFFFCSRKSKARIYFHTEIGPKMLLNRENTLSKKQLFSSHLRRIMSGWSYILKRVYFLLLFFFLSHTVEPHLE